MLCKNPCALSIWLLYMNIRLKLGKWPPSGDEHRAQTGTAKPTNGRKEQEEKEAENQNEI